MFFVVLLLFDGCYSQPEIAMNEVEKIEVFKWENSDELVENNFQLKKTIQNQVSLEKIMRIISSSSLERTKFFCSDKIKIFYNSGEIVEICYSGRYINFKGQYFRCSEGIKKVIHQSPAVLSRE